MNGKKEIKPVSILPCQRDAYQTKGTGNVVRGEQTDDGHHHIWLADSLLYPEGGGQPCDYGTINDIPVIDVQKAENGLVRCTTTHAIPPGKADISIDWARRFDHMQQHTAQHLLTALANSRLDAPTVGFHLGDTYAAIELDVETFSEDKQRQLLDWANAAIRDNHKVSWHTYTPEEYEAKSNEVRSRRLPQGHQGTIRVIDIEGLDSNTCGGTHVRTLGELQMIAIEGIERIRKRVRLRFLAGERVRRAFALQTQREQAITQQLNLPPTDHPAQVASLLASLQHERKARKHLQTELATFHGQQLANEAGTFHTYHREQADLSFLQSIASVCRDNQPNDLFFLSTSDAANGPGMFLIIGPTNATKEAGRIICEIMAGKGGGKPGTFQGKVNQIEARQEAITQLQTWWPQHTSTGE
jgi:Ser-tRNA(Ala) deacylase AlaX